MEIDTGHGIDLTINYNGTIQRAGGFPSAIFNRRCSRFRRCGQIILIHGDGRQGACIDDTAGTDDHAFGAQEIQVPANFIITDSLDGALDIDAVFYRIDKSIQCLVAIFLLEIQIGQFVAAYIEISKLI